MHKFIFGFFSTLCFIMAIIVAFAPDASVSQKMTIKSVLGFCFFGAYLGYGCIKEIKREAKKQK